MDAPYIIFAVCNGWQVHGPSDAGGVRPMVATFYNRDLAYEYADGKNAEARKFKRMEEERHEHEAMLSFVEHNGAEHRAG